MRMVYSRPTCFTLATLLMAGAYIVAYRRSPVPDWMLLVDFSFSLPLLHYFLFRPTFKQWALRWAQLTGLGILLGSVIIPESSRHIWPWLEMARGAAMVALVPVELAVMAGIAFAVWKLIGLDGDIDQALQGAMEKKLGTSFSSRLALFEARVWLYALFKPRHPRYAGEQHFSYAKLDGNASNQLGFIIAILFELPLAHLLLHFIWSPAAAWIASGLSTWGLLYLVAEYRATLARPISLDKDRLWIRCGVLSADALIPWRQILVIEKNCQPVRRQRGIRRYKQMGSMNIVIHLQPDVRLPDVFGRMQPVSAIYLGVDDVNGFIAAASVKVG